MKGNKFLAAVLAASMAFSVVPATALNVFAGAVSSISPSTTMIGGWTVSGGLANVYTDIPAADLQKLLETAVDTGVSATSGVDPSVSNITGVSATTDTAATATYSGSAYALNYGTVKAGFTFDADGSAADVSSPTAYTCSIAADKLADINAGTSVLADMAKDYIQNHSGLAGSDSTTTTDVQAALNGLGSNSATSTVMTALTNYASYKDGASGDTISFSLKLGDDFDNDGGTLTGTITVTGTAKFSGVTTTATTTVNLNASASHTLPTYASGTAVADVDDTGSKSGNLDAVKAYLEAANPDFTVSNLVINTYQAASHDYKTPGAVSQGQITASFTLTDNANDKNTKDYSDITFNAVHGIDDIKAEATKVVNDEIATLQKDTKKTLTKTAIVSKDDIAAKINYAVAKALGANTSSAAAKYGSTTAANSNTVYNDILKGFSDSSTYDNASATRSSVIETKITNYTAATAEAAGSVTGTINITYDYSDYMESGIRIQKSNGTYGASNIDGNVDDLSNYKSEIPFTITLAQLNKSTATKITGISSEKKVYNGSTATEITTVISPQGGKVDSTYKTTSGGSDAYYWEKQINLVAALNPTGANTYTIQWTSSNPDVASIDATEDSAVAVLTGNKEGYTKITASLIGTDGSVINSVSKTYHVIGFQFDDVEDSSKFFYDAVYKLYDNKIVTGVTDTTFNPYGEVSRADFVTMLYRAYLNNGGRKVVADSKFSDVATDKYYAAAVTWAANNGITNGTSATTFAPNKKVTRAEAVTFLYRAVDDESSYNVKQVFDDVDDASEYFYQPVYWAFANDITHGKTDKLFAPATVCTRGEAAVFVSSVMNRIN